jgi:hypothetical protein
MSISQKNAGDRFNGSQAKELNVFGQPKFELGRPMEMPRGPLDSQAPQQIQPQGQQGFMGSRKGAPSKFVPMQGAQVQRPQLAAPPAPQHAEMAGDEEVHTIDVHGVDPNGNEMVASFDAVFPRGYRILGARERQG